MDINKFIDDILTNKIDINSKTFLKIIEKTQQNMTNHFNYLNLPQTYIASDKLDAVMLKLKDTFGESDFWDFILPILDSKSLSDKVIQYLINNNICITTLGHMNLSEKWLIKLAPIVEEALFTLSQIYYLNNSYSLLKFQKLLNHFRENSSLFYYLLHIEPNNWEKWKWLIFYSNKYVKDSAIQNLSQNILLSEVLSKTNDIVYLTEQYQKNTTNPYILLGLASNFFTPNEILSNLIKISSVKYAKKIRNIALKNQSNKKQIT